ncbi:hypothetical protein EDB19DRAFT_1827324 [Suillus lakei]|nr:hypothetical protein EDB19DRAFT_1827324 [Suillus lakei]
MPRICYQPPNDSPEFDANDLGKPFPSIRGYKLGVVEHTRTESMVPRTENTPAIPFAIWTNSRALSSSEPNCARSSSPTRESPLLLRRQGDDEILETFDTRWMIGADGVVRKQLGFIFPGETRAEFRIVTGDIRLTGVGLDRTYWHRFGYLNDKCVSLRPTDEIGEDGWHFSIMGRDADATNLSQNEELIFETISSMSRMEISFNKLVYSSEYRANVRMVDKFSEGRVFLAGGTQLKRARSRWKLALVEKGLADKSLLETYNEERLPVITEMLGVTTLIQKRARTIGGTAPGSTTLLYMLGIHCCFSSIVLDEFATSVEGKPMNTYRILDETELEAGDRAPDAPKLLHVQSGESDSTTLFSLYRPWRHTVIVFAPSPADATVILVALEPYDKYVVRSAVILHSSAPAIPVASLADFVLLDQGTMLIPLT